MTELEDKTFKIVLQKDYDLKYVTESIKDDFEDLKEAFEGVWVFKNRTIELIEKIKNNLTKIETIIQDMPEYDATMTFRGKK